jgi:hypothetical protein
MATPKRKRKATRPTPNKRPKHADTRDGALSPSEELWEAESILEEKRVGRKLHYLVEWKGIDPQTGETYQPTWEPEINCTKALIHEWKSKKAARATTGAGRGGGSSTPRQRSKTQSLQPRPGRKSRVVVESSPEPSTAHSTTAPSTTAPSTTAPSTPRPLTPARESAAPALPSSAITTPIPANRPSPKIHIGPPTDSFDPGEYERYSQLAASQYQSATAPQTQDTDLDSSQLFTAGPEYRSSGVVPDSESLSGEESFVPATQQTTATTQHSSTANESQEDATEDSGLLEIIQQAASRPPSPATSIPETVYDTVADSQSQPRQPRASSQERQEGHGITEAAGNSSALPGEAPQESVNVDDQSVGVEVQSTPLVAVQSVDQQQDSHLTLLGQAESPSSLQARSQLIEASLSQAALPSGLGEIQHENDVQHDQESANAAEGLTQQPENTGALQDQVTVESVSTENQQQGEQDLQQQVEAHATKEQIAPEPVSTEDHQGEEEFQQQDDTRVPQEQVTPELAPIESQQDERDFQQQVGTHTSQEHLTLEPISIEDHQQVEPDLQHQVDACAPEEQIALDFAPVEGQQQDEQDCQQQVDACAPEEQVVVEPASIENQQRDEQGVQQPVIAPESLEGVTAPFVAATQEEHYLETHLAPTRTELILFQQHPAVEGAAGTSGEQLTGGAKETGNSLQANSQEIDEATLPEHSESGEAARSLFHSQLPLNDYPYPVSVDQPAQEVVPYCGSANTPVIDSETLSPSDWLNARSLETGATEPTQVSSDALLQDSQAAIDTLVSSTQSEDQGLPQDFQEPEPRRSQSPATVQSGAVEVETAHSTCASQSVEETVLRRDFALGSPIPQSINQTTPSREQNAQIVYPNNDLSTQEDTGESIRPSVEKADITSQSTPDSRHDSSQDTPERQYSPLGHSSSPIAQPPDHSLIATNSQVPSRPRTPIVTSSLSIMASQELGDGFFQSMEEGWEKHKSSMNHESEFLHKIKGSVASASIPARIDHTEGTRSPSTIPDRLPVPAVPSSLRTVAFTSTEETRDNEVGALSVDLPAEIVRNNAQAEPAIIRTEAIVANVISSDNEELSDATDDDNVSLLNDDLQLATEEYIVPLFVEGRQSDEYSLCIDQKSKVLNDFITDPHGSNHFVDVEGLLARLRSIETHIDLVYQEAALTTSSGMNDPTQIEFTLQFSIDNAIKFRFLHSLFHAMRQQRKNIVLVTQDNNDALFNIIEMFCKANCIRYKMPTRGRQADPARVDGELLVTILPSTSSHIIQPADGIICLDGVQDATQIRQKHWAVNPELQTVPVLHLVISRTVGHIERYLSSSLDGRQRAHTILATLAYMAKAKEVGKPIDEDMLRAPVAAEHVAEWFQSEEKDRSEWPLGSIGTVKSVIEYQTQASQTSAPSLAPERSKRPHDDEALDPAKRMRFTPQPQDTLSSSVNENEVTRISDSMPGTTTDDASVLRVQLARMQEAFEMERAARKSEEERFREQELMWNEQQTVHENLTREHRLLLNTHQKSEERVGTITKQNETLRERLETRTKEAHAVTNQLDEQRNTHLLSDDAKVAEVTKLRTELAKANAEKDRAVKNAATTEATLDYTKEQYRVAQDTATIATATIKDLEAQVEKLSHTASGEPAKLKALHLNRQYGVLTSQVKSLKAENSTLKKTLAQKEEELARAKQSGGRMGVGTRATSVTPQPNKVRSRAASPMMRQVSNLRNG